MAAQTSSPVVQWASPPSQASALARLALTATTGGMGGAAGSISQAGTLLTPIVNGPRQGVVDKCVPTRSVRAGRRPEALTAMPLSSPPSVRVCSNGNLFFGNTGLYKISVLNATTGAVITIAGTGSAAAASSSVQGAGYTADGVATSKPLGAPAGVALSADGGTVYWAEYTVTFSVRQVVLSTGLVSTFVGTGLATYGEGTGTTAGFVYPYALAVDYTRNVMYVADASNYRIRAVNMATRATSTLAGTGASGHADGGPGVCTLYPYSIAIAPGSGTLYVADATSFNIRVVSPAGVCTTLAGPGASQSAAAGTAEGMGTNAKFGNPRGITIDLYGNL